MTATSNPPTEATHLGADDLPFVDIGGGNLLKVLLVHEEAGLWITENSFQKGFTLPRHRHTGPVFAYTGSGAWKYQEYDYTNQADSFLFEPAGSIHTLRYLEDNTRVWFQMEGVNLDLDDAGSVRFPV